MFPLEEFIINHGFIDKSEAAGREKLDLLFRASTFFILLSQAETFGIVYTEAAAYALPSLANRVGGVTEAVSDGETALTFAPHASVEEVCDKVLGLRSDLIEYRRMSHAALELFRTRFDWRIIGEQLGSRLDLLVADSRNSVAT
jgi:glycosyltransferase involved in cell wall biosynthesis